VVGWSVHQVQDDETKAKRPMNFMGRFRMRRLRRAGWEGLKAGSKPFAEELLRVLVAVGHLRIAGLFVVLIPDLGRLIGAGRALQV
jgi:hypothetical protein